jgi:hypothetical protein
MTDSEVNSRRRYQRILVVFDIYHFMKVAEGSDMSKEKKCQTGIPRFTIASTLKIICFP